MLLNENSYIEVTLETLIRTSQLKRNNENVIYQRMYEHLSIAFMTFMQIHRFNEGN